MATYPKAWRWLIASVLIVTMIFPALSVAAPAPVREASPLTESSEVAPPAGLSGAEWASIQDQIRQAEYYLTWQAPDGANPAYRAPNRAQGFGVAFAPSGFTARGEDWHLSLTLTGYGDTALPPSADLSAQRDTATYRWSDSVSEWYVNGPEGVEHGFTLNAPPARGDVRLTLALDTDLVPTLSADGQALTLRRPATGDWQVGPAVLRYDSLRVTDATGRQLPAHLEYATRNTQYAIRNTQYLLHITFDAADAVYPLTVDPLLYSQVGKLTTPDGAAGDYFGYAVAISGDTVVVGAYGDDNNGDASGSAYVFTRNEGGADGWGGVAKLTASDGTAGDYFGHAVAISGDTVIVTAYGDDDHGHSSGSAYVFRRNQGGPDSWGQAAKLTAADGAAYDSFGTSVAISGDTIVVGANLDDDKGADSGSAYVFRRNRGGADNWGQAVKLTASDGAAGDYFGISVSISSDTIVIGAYGDDDHGSSSGSAYIFTRNQGWADNWGQAVKLTAADGAADDYFGWSVAISGDTIVVGAWRDDDYYGVNSGSAYIFRRNHGGADAWGQWTKLTAADGAAGDNFGSSVAISGYTIVVGAYGDDDHGADSGSAYTFVGAGNVWVQQAKPTAADGAAGDGFGMSVAISGDTIVVGSLYGDGNVAGSGSAYAFRRNEGGLNGWGQVAKLTAADGAAGDGFGVSVAISGDTIVVGAFCDEDNGANSGSAYVFRRNQGGADKWGQAVKLTAADGAAYDEFGVSVAISGDTVVVGSPGDADHGADTGSAYVFRRNQGGADHWGQWTKLTAADGAAGDYFGISVAISGDTLVVGSPGDDDNGAGSGSAYVFRRNQGGPGAWGRAAKLTAADGAAGDQFGVSVAISGDTVVVGADGDADHGANTGSAYIFTRNRGGADNWGQAAKLTAADGAAYDEFGYAVGISGDTVVVGAFWDDDHGADSGSAYVFRWTTPVVGIGPAPDLTIAKAVTPASAVPGDPITYTLTFSNAGDLIATGVVITDIVPVSLTVQSVVSSGVAITDTGASPPYVWDVQDLAPGAGGVITVSGVLSNPLAAGTFTNTVAIATSDTESDLDNNESSASVTVSTPPGCHDFNQDGQVSALDIQAVADRWRMRDTDPGWGAAQPYDVDGNGIITVLDIMLVAAQWGPCP
jgi:uncharacterized repeat protein (TIGR01451 family)